jgi:acyl transferase domain-containing protein
MYAAGARIFIEFGPRDVLTNLVKNILKGREHIAIALNPSPQKDSDLQFRQALSQLQVLGLPITNADPHKRIMPAPRSLLR